MDPDLARYLNRNYWEQKSEEVSAAKTTATATAPSAPAESQPSSSPAKIEERFQNGHSDAEESQFLDALQRSVEIFVNRMKSNSSRGRSIANDSSVQSLFQTINAMHPQLMKYIGQQEDARCECLLNLFKFFFNWLFSICSSL
jgi:growth factor-regulated tyrosine kinase substrate